MYAVCKCECDRNWKNIGGASKCPNANVNSNAASKCLIGPIGANANGNDNGNRNENDNENENGNVKVKANANAIRNFDFPSQIWTKKDMQHAMYAFTWCIPHI